MITGRTEHTDLTDLTTWFVTAPPGAWFVYAIGDLAFDRRSKRSAPPKMLDVVGRRAMEWADLDYVFLFQRRMTTRGFAYIAQRRAVSDAFERHRIAREHVNDALRVGVAA
jgi:hypothetical protein